MLTAELARAVPEAELAPAAEGDAFFKLAPMSREEAGQSLSISGVQRRGSARTPEGGEPSLRRGARSKGQEPASQLGPAMSQATPNTSAPSTVGPSGQEARASLAGLASVEARSVPPGADRGRQSFRQRR